MDLKIVAREDLPEYVEVVFGGPIEDVKISRIHRDKVPPGYIVRFDNGDFVKLGGGCRMPTINIFKRIYRKLFHSSEERESGFWTYKGDNQ